MESAVVNDAIVRPLARHIDAPLSEILDVLRGRVSCSERENFDWFARLAEASTECDFFDLRRRIKRTFRLFSDGASGKEFVERLGKSFPSKSDLIQRELRFVTDFITLMQTAHYELLSKEMWETALREDFELTMPIKVNEKVMDSKMLTRFWTERPDQREALPDIADRMLIFYRGVSLGRKKDLFIGEKLDLLVTYLIVNPCTYLWNRFTKKDLTSKETDDTTVKEEEALEIETVRRVTLRELLPDWRMVMGRLFSRIEIHEPMLNSVVVLYRKARGTLMPSTNYTKANYQQAKRNIVIKMFDGVPSADLEMIFPEKVVDIRRSSWIYILITLIVALVSALVTVWQTDIELAVVGSALMLVLGKAFQSYTSMQREKAAMMMNISKMLYEKTRDAQEGALFTLLDDMADQHLKDLCLAYMLLLLAGGRTLRIDDLDRSCEAFLLENFGRRIDFCLRDKLPHLITSGLVKEDSSDKELLRAVDLETAIEVLTEKWNGYHQKLDCVAADESFLDSPAARTLALGVGAVGGVASIGVSAAHAVTSKLSAGFKGILRGRSHKKTNLGDS